MQINLLYFSYITSEVKEYYEVLFLSYRPPDLRQLAVSFSIFQDKFHSYNSGSQKHTWAFNETVQKISKITYTASSQAPSLQRNFNRVIRFNIIKNLLFIFYLQVYDHHDVNTRGTLSTPASDVHERLKTNGKAMKIAKNN